MSKEKAETKYLLMTKGEPRVLDSAKEVLNLLIGVMQAEKFPTLGAPGYPPTRLFAQIFQVSPGGTLHELQINIREHKTYSIEVDGVCSRELNDKEEDNG